eukprot:Skav213820  [mRNA]  locus=scaffold1987:591830:597615:+ [translate_table: standard]
MFVLILFMIYGFHAAHYDTMDIGDYGNLVELLEDDNGICLDAGQNWAAKKVGTLMLIFHSIFEWLYWRETHRFRWLGLPSMWFTSSDAYADLIHHAKGHSSERKVNKVFPEEMALFSLSARNACQLRRSLRHAKLYNVHKASFLTRAYDAKSSCLQSLPSGADPEAIASGL